MYNEVIIKDPTIPQIHCYTTSWYVNVRKLAIIWKMFCFTINLNLI